MVKNYYIQQDREVCILKLVPKITRIMKLTCLLLCLSIGMVFASQSYAQTTKLSVLGTEKTVAEVLEEIEQQTDFQFFYNNKIIDVNRKVSINVQNEDVFAILNRLFKESNVRYKVIGKDVILTTADVVGVDQEGRKVVGKVTDHQGEPVIGVNVVEKGTTNGTTTDLNGSYSLMLVNDDAVLQFSYIGYTTKDIVVGNKSDVSVSLLEDSQALEEVVVVGYGTAKKVNLTGAVAQIDNKTMENRSVTNIGKALQGVVGNLNMTVSGNGGAPGSTMDYNVRGTTSLSGGSPLFIVDGVPADNINNINPADVETLTVLKDAASAAIYGARAAYGVILVTTKKGTKNEKVTVSYNNVVGYNHATCIPNQVNSLDFANAYNIASLNSGQSPMFSDEHIERIKAYMADLGHYPSNIPNPNNTDYWSYATLDNDNVDWFRAFFKPGSWNHKHDLSVKGGTEKSRCRLL